MANNLLLASVGPFLTLGGIEWTAVFGLSKGTVVAGAARPNTLGVEAGQVYTGVAFPNDHISECSINLNANNTTNFQLCVRMQSGAYSGYKVAIGGTTRAVTIYRMDAGVATQLGVTTVAAAFASGDLWQFVASGSVLNVYLNYSRVLYVADDTYTGGSPGFIQFSSTDLSQTNCLYWNGYSIVQQDGIWSKRGVVLPLKAADIASSGFGVWNMSYIDPTPVAGVLGLGGNVYRMVFNGNGQSAGNPGATFYAESLDGLTWVRRSPAVLTNFTIESIAFDSGLYYGFGQTGQAQGTGPVHVYTSPDLITWTLAASSILTLGTAGAWDDTQIYVQCNPVLLAGTWYMLYGGGHSTPTSFNSGIATATNLLGPWTKYGSNPVLSPAVSGPINKVGSTFYTWTAVGPGLTHKRLSVNNAFNPVETVRYQSTDMLTWTPTGGVRSLHNTQLYESPNTVTGNCTSCILTEIGGRVYNYYIGSPSDSTPPQYYQISLALGPVGMSLAELVTHNEDTAYQIDTDAFPGANGDLSASWTTPTGGTKLTIVSNKVRPTTLNAYNIMKHSGTYDNDHYAEVTVQTIAANAFTMAAVRIQSGANSAYVAQCGAGFNAINVNANIVKVTAGVGVAIGPAATATWQIGDKLRLSVIDNVLTMYQNSAVILQVQDSVNSFPTGQPGMGCYASVLANAEISLWAAGNFGAAIISGNAGTPFATVAYSGPENGSVVADGAGAYSISLLVAGSYTITPSKTGYRFSPVNQVEVYINAVITGVDFVASLAPGGGAGTIGRYSASFQVVGAVTTLTASLQISLDGGTTWADFVTAASFLTAAATDASVKPIIAGARYRIHVTALTGSQDFWMNYSRRGAPVKLNSVPLTAPGDVTFTLSP